MATWIIVMLFRALTYVHDPIHRHLIDDFDADEQRTWCFVQYSPAFKIFNSFITLFHFIVFPFSINFISGIAIIVSMARTRTNANNKTSFKQNLQLQLHQHKHLLGGISSSLHIVHQLYEDSTRTLVLFVGYFLKSIDNSS